MSFVKFLGVGGAVANPNRRSPSILVKADSSKYAVLDMSAFTYCALSQIGLELIDLIFISHRHADHIGGLLNFLHSLEVSTIPTLNKEPVQKDRVTVLGFPDASKQVEKLTEVGFVEFPEWQPIPVNIIDYPSWQNYEWENFRFQGVRVQHTDIIENIVLKVTNIKNNNSFVYTGDIRPSKDTFNKLANIAKGSKFIIGDISAPIAELGRDPNKASHPGVDFWGKFIQTYKGHIYFVHTYGVDTPNNLRRYILKYANLVNSKQAYKRLHFPKIGEVIKI